MNKHQFLFTSGYWIGEGKITFSGSDDVIKFYTRWIIPEGLKEHDLGLKCTQEVEMQGTEKKTINNFHLLEITDDSFVIHLNNEVVDDAEGKGIIGPKKIAWEFRNTPNFDGYEVYELQENGDYLFHAEYVSPDLFRSIIDGRIWLKTGPIQNF